MIASRWVRWARHDVLFHRTGRKRLHHPVVGGLDLTYEAMEFPADPGLTLLVYTAEPNSPTADALQRLDENLGAAGLTLTPDDIAELDTASAAIDVQGERYPEQMQRMIDR